MSEDKDASDGNYEVSRPYGRHGRWMKHWMRHTALVPKGFLRYQLLRKLSERPMSGSEIMNELENETKGYWKPSPGSIYPLLAWLQDQRYVEEAQQTDPGIRRYTLTAQGKAFLDAETKSREEINKRLQSFGNMWYGPHQIRAGETGRAARDFFRAVRDLHHELRSEHSKDRLEETKKALEEVTKQIQEITKTLQG